MRTIRTTDGDFDGFFAGILARGGACDETVLRSAEEIVAAVARRGDAALFAYTEQYDGVRLTAETLAVTPEELAAAVAEVPAGVLDMLKLAAERIERFHRHQMASSWMDETEEGVRLGQRLVPLERVGLYVPGGRAAYPSTVLMAAIPAKLAGVEEIIIVSPLREGKLHPLVAAAAQIAGVSRILKVGGAQAVAALAYGTASVPRVDKIVGPGNAYVAAAKRLIFGQADIDMIAGPSEVLILADGSVPAAFAAADLIAQAEHDEMASAVLMTTDPAYAEAVAAEVRRQTEGMTRRVIVERSLERYGAIVLTRDQAEAVTLANRFAPEHLELMLADAEQVLPAIRNAGAVFLGGWTPEALGDYLAGPNHILPTAGTARFSSALGVYDFVKRISVLEFSETALRRYGALAKQFADLEGLEGHGASLGVRLEAAPSENAADGR